MRMNYEIKMGARAEDGQSARIGLSFNTEQTLRIGLPFLYPILTAHDRIRPHYRRVFKLAKGTVRHTKRTLIPHTSLLNIVRLPSMAIRIDD